MGDIERPRYWNVWWTLTMISAALTLVALVLEALGVFRDLGLALSLAGLLLTAVFGLSASTRSSLGGFRGEVMPRLDRMDGRLGQLDVRLGQVDAHLGQMTDRLDRIVTILDERLPRPTA